MAAGDLPEVMVMPGTPRDARLLPRLARLLISRNELRRSYDRVEGAVVMTLLAAFIAAVVAACFVAAHTYQSQRAAGARLRPAVAVLSQNGPTDILNGTGEAQAGWRAPDGRQRSGMLTTLVAPGIWNATRGARVRIWVTSTGEPATPPPDRTTMILSSLAIPLWWAGGAAIFLIICYWLCRLALDRRRLAAWESAWALVGPRWTTRR
jgi:hypothetical protein